MSKIISQAFVVGIACLVAASYLWAANDTATEKSVWVGITVCTPNEGENEYLIGTVDEAILDEIELDKYKRRFLRISNLRIQKELEGVVEGNALVHYDCADKYDLGVILIQYKDIASIEFKKHDPLTVD